MNVSFKQLFSDRIISVSFWGSIIFLLVAVCIAALAYPHLPPFLPIYNKLVWGYARLGHTYEIAIPIVVAFFFAIVNTLLARLFYTTTPLLSRFLLLITLFVSLFTCIFIVKLTLIIL